MFDQPYLGVIFLFSQFKCLIREVVAQQWLLSWFLFFVHIKIFNCYINITTNVSVCVLVCVAGSCWSVLRDLCVLPSLSCPTEKASTSGNQHTQPPLASCQAGQRVRGDLRGRGRGSYRKERWRRGEKSKVKSCLQRKTGRGGRGVTSNNQWGREVCVDFPMCLRAFELDLKGKITHKLPRRNTLKWLQTHQQININMEQNVHLSRPPVILNTNKYTDSAETQIKIQSNSYVNVF